MQKQLRDKFKKLYCNSPLYDPQNHRDDQINNKPAPDDYTILDFDRKPDKEKRYPGLGTFHIHHRIGDVLVGLSVFDLTDTTITTNATISDPAYSFLHLDAILKVHEIEYFKMLKKNYKPHLSMMFLGEFSPTSNKLC